MCSKCLLLILMALIFQSAYGQNRQNKRNRYELYSDRVDVHLQNNGHFKDRTLSLTHSPSRSQSLSPSLSSSPSQSPSLLPPPPPPPTSTSQSQSYLPPPLASPAPSSIDSNPYYDDEGDTDLDEFDEIDTYADDLLEPYVSQGAHYHYKQRAPTARGASTRTNCEQQLRRQLQQIWRRNPAIRRRANIQRNQQAWRRRQQQKRKKHQQTRRREDIRRRRRRRQ